VGDAELCLDRFNEIANKGIGDMEGREEVTDWIVESGSEYVAIPKAMGDRNSCEVKITGKLL